MGAFPAIAGDGPVDWRTMSFVGIGYSRDAVLNRGPVWSCRA